MALSSSGKQTIAVIGSGMAGLAAAYGCRQNGHEVTVFEAEDGHGMDAHSMTVDGGIVDVPLRVMSPDFWPAMLSLADSVGVETFRVSTRTSCSWLDGTTWFRSGRLPVLDWPSVGSVRYLNGRALRLTRGLFQLSRLTRKMQDADNGLTLRDALKQHRLDPLFWRGLMLPVLTTICTCDEDHLLAWPAAQLLPMLGGILNQADLYRLKGGTSALVEQLAKDLTLKAGSPVTEVREMDGGVRVHNARGDGGLFDRAILATQANALEYLDATRFAEERRVLSDIHFASGELWVHRDKRFMPASRTDWTALNFQMDRALEKPMFTVWVNAVEPTMAHQAPVFQTWNPLYEPKADKVLARVPLQRAVVHAGTAQVHDKLQQWHRQPDRKVFFCGSWAYEGVPLLESAVRSAQVVVDLIGKAGKAMPA
ncbi:FAD-dependent oxidoreductase [Marinobacter nanhaiticus D15-8W]|uniref:FAD-dependent oxidoreductase n=1 Tax=Marinobacter nanhaiticus D15-8W TaxID=626887 RepID=N6W6K4_9GAMM|nr:FAD-dependent oxidoreductase [Marinobacter nanhaiticus]ENO15889.1 FAD-dependent oxidoreductase [Marinobacter nanhaiticus D15-8W]BES73253.1 FAD-dependent oxidoreductase [Marinobacter nanhaiticus D15-8W]